MKRSGLKAGRNDRKRNDSPDHHLTGRMNPDRSGCLEHLARFQTPRADAHAFGRPLYESAYVLQIGFEPPLRAVVGVRYSIAELGTLAADFTAFRHYDLPRMIQPDELK
jgi:hypothetical protein